MPRNFTRILLLFICFGSYSGLSSQSVSFVGTRANVNENSIEIDIVARIVSGGPSPSSTDLEILPIGTSTNGADYGAPVLLQFQWPANANNVNSTLKFTINNDLLPEQAEYFIVRMINPVNVTLPAPSLNHFTVMILDNDKQVPMASKSIELNHIASFSNSATSPKSAEIVAFDAASKRLFIANSLGKKLDIVNFSNPAAATLITSVLIETYGNINSVAVKNGIVAVAIENTAPQSPGKVVFFDVNGVFVKEVNVGAMPDMITFNNAGNKVLTANEGEPNDAYTNDPEGSISIIDISGGVAGITNANVTTANFVAFNSQMADLKTAGVRLFGPNASVAQDMEPESITLSANDDSAFVTCQENNAIAVVDMATSTIVRIMPLGTKDHFLTPNALDVSDQGTSIQIANWPVKGFYMPDALASYTVAGQTYLVTANEGDARDYSGYSEQLRLSSASYVLDPVKFPYADALKANLGRINVTTATGNTDGDGDFDEIHVFGGRSISIVNAATGALVWDSKDDMEQIISKDPVYASIFNASNTSNTLKNRSDDKGPEPEGVSIATLFGRTFAFIALERIGGCMVYDITDPANPTFVDYKNTRTVPTYGGDNGPEGILYISAAESPNGAPIIVLANEVSSTLSFYGVSSSVLNITLSNFSAENDNSRNVVKWITAGELAGDVFELERSKDGRTFSYVSTFKANGIASSYLYNDEKPFNGWNFYRLKLKHKDGIATYSKIVSAVVKGIISMSVKVYPNPSINVVTIETAGRPSALATLQVFNQQGVLVHQQKVTNVQTQIPIKRWAPGMYQIRYIDDAEVYTSNFIKQ